MSQHATIIITGANRGIGAALLQSLSTSPFHTPLTILACARNPPSPPPTSPSSSAEVHWHALDISSPASITTFASHVRTTYPSGIDVLISNAGVNLDISTKHGPDTASKTLATNFTGTLNMMRAFAPMLRRPGLPALGVRSRIVNVSSVGGKLSSGSYAPEIARRLKGAETTEEVEALGREYLEAVGERREKGAGWPTGKNYSVSKALLNAASEVVAREEGNEDVCVNFCCPGWCDSDMGRLIGRPGKSNEEGARVVLKLAVGDVGGVTGRYWENRSVYDKGTGEVAEW